MLNRKRLAALALGAVALAGFSPAISDTIPRPMRFAAAPSRLPAGQLAVLTYNVNGLPFPAAFDRPRALAAIGDSLARMRADGTAPQVVVLQEAFTPEARAIAARAGYRFAAFGPDSGDAQPELAGFSPERSLWKGEAFGPAMSSGLVMLSDYKLSHIRHTPFPRGACAGYDCLANKGILAARVDVPGVSAAVEVVATHLNSGNPSGQPEAVSRVAYARQIDALADFTDGPDYKRTVSIYAGDFNMGHSPARLELLMGYIRHKKAKVATAMGRDKYAPLCRETPGDCDGQAAIPANVPLRHANDWQFFTAPAGVHLDVIGREVMFKPGQGKKPLSDHMGLKVVYRFQ